MKHISKTLRIETKKKIELIDITSELEDFVEKCGIKNGYCLVYLPHATAALVLNENEEGLTEDILRKIEELFPVRGDYLHNRIDDNAHAHLASTFLGTSRIFPIIEGRLIRGTWQNLFFAELDGPRKSRTVIFQAIGE